MTKTLQDIPANAVVMVDANIILYALFQQVDGHEACRKLLERGASNELDLRIVVNAAADVIHRAMILETISLGLAQRSAEAVVYLKSHPEAVQQLTKYKMILRDLTRSGVTILPLTYRDLHSSKQYRDKYGVMTNDSLILAVMNRERIQYLATNDSDFERDPGIAVRLLK